MRKAFKILVRDSYIFGTYHEPTELDSKRIRDRVNITTGFLFLNMGHAPRACHGNLVARIGDRLAEMGFPVMRIDYPGIGDSPGDLPSREESFWLYVMRSGFTQLTREVMNECSKLYSIDRYIVGGLCGGAIASIYLAASEPTRVLGTVLLEPEFTVPSLQRNTENVKETVLASEDLVYSLRTLKKLLLSPRSWIRAFSGKSQYEYHIKTLKTIAIKKLRAIQGKHLPVDTNHLLIESWKELIESRRPCLVMFAQGESDEVIYKEINNTIVPRYILDRVVTEHSIPKTNHTFTTQGADKMVISYISRWTQKNLV